LTVCNGEDCRSSERHHIPASLYEAAKLAGPEEDVDARLGHYIDEYRYGVLVGVLADDRAAGRVYLSAHPPLRRLPGAWRLLEGIEQVDEARATLFRRMRELGPGLYRIRDGNILRPISMSGGHAYNLRAFSASAWTVADEKQAREAQRRGWRREEVDLIAQAAMDDLQLAHAHGVIVQDLRPQVIMLAREPTDPWTPRIMDLSSATTPDSDYAQWASPHDEYGAPEVCSFGQEGLGPSCDVYALAAVLRSLMGDLSKPERAFFEHAMAKDASKRFQCIPEFRDAWRSTFVA
jgi:hypothetical protein